MRKAGDVCFAEVSRDSEGMPSCRICHYWLAYFIFSFYFILLFFFGGGGGGVWKAYLQYIAKQLCGTSSFHFLRNANALWGSFECCSKSLRYVAYVNYGLHLGVDFIFHSVYIIKGVKHELGFAGTDK